MTVSPIYLAPLFLTSAAISYMTTYVVKHAAEQAGLFDRPDDERRIHERETPRIGGLAIIFGFGFPLLLLAGNSHAAELVSKNIAYLCAVLASGSLIVGLGVYDDIVGTDAPRKFLVQTASAVILVAFGFHFDAISLGGYVIDLGLVGWLLSIGWIVGVINAFNFIDGMDSLATVVAITIALAFAAIAIIRADTFSLVLMTALAGSLIGFYRWNKPPARIFMGDTGSMFIGLLLAADSIVKPSKSPVALAVAGPILALALPVMDTLIVMKQRFGGPAVPLWQRVTRMFNADRRHIHHILIEKYGSPGKAIASIWAVSLLFGVAAVMTVAEETKIYGYTAGIAGFAGMIFFRYWFRRASAGEQPAV
jgi:UDP-GlcNAc:undecaprenyl-phosphate/decaprenyl-phosphate GlcNAc-1-phosphate transferase